MRTISKGTACIICRRPSSGMPASVAAVGSARPSTKYFSTEASIGCDEAKTT